MILPRARDICAARARIKSVDQMDCASLARLLPARLILLIFAATRVGTRVYSELANDVSREVPCWKKKEQHERRMGEREAAGWMNNFWNAVSRRCCLVAALYLRSFLAIGLLLDVAHLHA